MHRVIPGLCVALALQAASSGQDLSRVPAPEQAEAARLFKIYREGADMDAREKAAGDLALMHPAVIVALVPILERDWQLAVTGYLAAVQRAASEVARRRSADPAFVREVAAHRATMAKLRGAGAGLTKERIQAEGEPALRRLRELHTITVADLAVSHPTIGLARTAATTLTRIRAMVKRKTILRNDQDYAEADLARAEASAVARAFRRNPQIDKILDANAEIAAKGAVPPEEVEGVRHLNAMRILAGLAPLLLDPKLHAAARGHSEDMATLNFFAHESPVPGKKTPSDRAKLAGTTAGAENIFAGSTNPVDANESWFGSPGHHVNMFGSHRRCGMGRHGATWTELFGG